MLENGKTYVTWNGLIGILLPIMALSGALISWGWAVHTARPHNGTASHDEVIRVTDMFRADLTRNIDQAREDRKSLEAHLQRVEDKIDNLIQKLN